MLKVAVLWSAALSTFKMLLHQSRLKGKTKHKDKTAGLYCP